MKKTLILALGTGIVLGCLALVLPTNVEAAGANDVETNFYTCPAGATSLAQCTWNGLNARDCFGGHLVEGSLTGNFKMTHAEACHDSSQSTVCWYNVTGVWDPCPCLIP